MLKHRFQPSSGTPSPGKGCPFFIFFLLLPLFSGLIQGCSDETGNDRLAGNEPGLNLNDPNQRPDWMAAPVEEPADPARAMPAADEERQLLIGVIGPESGAEAHFGLQTLDGVQRAAKRFNAAGGIGGKPIEIIHADNQDDLTATETIINDFIQKRVVAIIAAPTGWSTFGPTRLANRSHTLFMAVGSRRRIAHSGDYVFHLALPVEAATGQVIARAASGLTDRHFALVSSSVHVHSLKTASAFKQAIGKQEGRVVLEADLYDSYSGTINIDTVIQALRGSATPFEAVVFTGGAEEGALLAKAMRGAGLRQPLIGGEDLFSETFLKTGAEAVTGTLLYGSFDPKQPYATGDGDTPTNRFSALAHDAFSIIATAIGTSGNTKPSKVRETLLATTGFSGVTGKTRFTEAGEPIKRPFLYRVERNADGLVFTRLMD